MRRNPLPNRRLTAFSKTSRRKLLPIQLRRLQLEQGLLGGSSITLRSLALLLVLDFSVCGEPTCAVRRVGCNRITSSKANSAYKNRAASCSSKATDVAADVQEIVSTKAADLADAAKHKAAQWSNHVGNAFEDVGSRVQANVERVAGAAHRARHDLRDRLQSASSNAYSEADDLFHYAASAGKNALDDEELAINCYLVWRASQ